MLKERKPNTLAVIDNDNFYDRQTHKLTDERGNPAQKAESVKI